jgi:type II secretory pathway component GspD/PulD (secretin)
MRSPAFLFGSTLAAALFLAAPAAAQEGQPAPKKPAQPAAKPPQEAPAKPAEKVAEPFPITEFLDARTIRKPNGMIVRYYRCDAVDPELVKQELERWKTEKASIVAVGPSCPAGFDRDKSVVRKNTLRIEETEENWAVLDGVLAMVDAPQPQVYVEAKIVEIQFDDDLRIGIGPGTNIRVDRPVGDLFFKRVDLVFDNVLGNSDSSEFTFGSDDKFVKFDYILNLGKSGATAEVKSEPGILAAQGEVASIKVGDQEPIVQQNLAGNNVTTSTKFEDVGLLLEIQPLMIGRDVVRARVNARLSRVSDFRITSTSNDRDVINPVISEREAKSVIEVVDGDTVVIAGLQQTAEFDQRKGIPLLMDIPYLGYLFGSTSKREVKTELVFFVTFSIVRPGESRLIVPPGELERTEGMGEGDEAFPAAPGSE